MDLFLDTAHRCLPFELPTEEGYSWQWDSELNLFRIAVPNGEMLFSEQFFNSKVSDRSFEYFQENDTLDWRHVTWRGIGDEALRSMGFKNIKWQHDHIKMYGKSIPLPRLTAWYGDPGKCYSYSGIHSEPNAWNKGLLYIKERVESVTNAKFNSVLLNWYRDGADHLHWHADDEKELGVNPVIASANFGATRDFVIRRNDDHKQRIVLPLKHGSLLVMGGAMQHHWQHSVPKRKHANGSRFNLTFRKIREEFFTDAPHNKQRGDGGSTRRL